jgi:hypothetical protein
MPPIEKFIVTLLVEIVYIDLYIYISDYQPWEILPLVDM